MPQWAYRNQVGQALEGDPEDPPEKEADPGVTIQTEEDHQVDPDHHHPKDPVDRTDRAGQAETEMEMDHKEIWIL